ncbi:MAG: hypothetical protein A2X12_10515 [Bacteroidetes bacterium GWE2_29_8]|nr:MAG: hypothetical protein A2X12_10515 [Bacteroidetes bacterium GWE2_29_8]OFY23211.1 MAG: hypothetical protein A2X02_09450 [Bacteroidetes bacterium GWF2_29_10]
MLINDLYKYNIISKTDSEIRASIILNKDNLIYKGHFPNIPITPGVCQILIIKEILKKELKINLMIELLSEVKFLAMHNPLEKAQIESIINYKYTDTGRISVTGLLYSDEIKYLKFKGEFK